MALSQIATGRQSGQSAQIQAGAGQTKGLQISMSCGVTSTGSLVACLEVVASPADQAKAVDLAVVAAATFSRV